VLPAVVMDEALPVGLRADVVRLEILRQHGGVYFDADFEALREDLRPLFADQGSFYYGDEKSGRPSNAFMAAPKGHAFLDLMLQRIASGWEIPEDVWKTVNLTGPGRLAECLNFWVGDWRKPAAVTVDGQRVGSSYAQGSVTGLWKECCYPYHYEEGTWATFDPAAYPQAWAAHHWEGGWHREGGSHAAK
jgi:mannosyltransferase OCH1-like enzyme